MRSVLFRSAIAALFLASTLSLWSCSGGFAWFGGTGASYDASQPPDGPGLAPGPIADTWTGIHLFQVFDGRIPRVKAKRDAPLYDLVWGTVEPSAWKDGNWQIVTSYYAPFCISRMVNPVVVRAASTPLRPDD